MYSRWLVLPLWRRNFHDGCSNLMFFACITAAEPVVHAMDNTIHYNHCHLPCVVSVAFGCRRTHMPAAPARILPPGGTLGSYSPSVRLLRGPVDSTLPFLFFRLPAAFSVLLAQHLLACARLHFPWPGATFFSSLLLYYRHLTLMVTTSLKTAWYGAGAATARNTFLLPAHFECGDCSHTRKRRIYFRWRGDALPRLQPPLLQ